VVAIVDIPVIFDRSRIGRSRSMDGAAVWRLRGTGCFASSTAKQMKSQPGRIYVLNEANTE
jgi:hypothetical protein